VDQEVAAEARESLYLVVGVVSLVEEEGVVDGIHAMSTMASVERVDTEEVEGAVGDELV